MSDTISVLGLGRWATTLAWYLDQKKFKVILWGREEEVNDLLNCRKNKYVKLPEKIKITNNLKEAIEDSKFLIIAILSQGMREVCSKLSEFDLKNKIIVIAMKGLEDDTCLTMSQIVEEKLGKVDFGILAGPAFPENLTKKRKSYLVVSSKDRKIAKEIAQIFSSEFVRLDVVDDIIGVQLGAAAKNVINILVGICDGLECGDYRAGLVNFSLKEIEELGKKMGARSETFRGLSFLGDLFLTCLSHYSRNKKFGELLSKGKKMENIPFSAEGVIAAKVFHQLAQKYKVNMPVFESVYESIFLNKPCKEVIEKLWESYPRPG